MDTIHRGNQDAPELKELQKQLSKLTIVEKRNQLEAWIPDLNDTEKKEIFDMIQSYQIPHSKNRNGVFINLAGIKEDMIDRLYSYCHYYQKSHTMLELDSFKQKESTFSAIDQSLLQECVRDAIKDSLSQSLQKKLNSKLSIFVKESNWKHTAIPNNHSKNAELGKVRGRINRKKNHILKRCRDISLYLQKNTGSKDQDVLSGTNELSLDS